MDNLEELNSLEYQREIGGIITFGGLPSRPKLVDEQGNYPDCAIIGAPFDLGTTNRAGARNGPRALRANAYNSGSNHIGHEIEIFDHLNVVDAGDAWCPHGQVDRCLDNIKNKVHQVAKHGVFPVTIGGDHTIVWPAVEALAEVYGYGRIGMIHFDAHADTADSIDGTQTSHGTPMRRLIESNAVRADRFVQIGLRSYWPGPDVWEWMKNEGMTWYLMDEIFNRGILAVVNDAIVIASNDCDAVYLSVDIDCLDPAFAPGTGTPEPGGMNVQELIQAVRLVTSRCNLVGMDLCEISPAYDVSDVTTNSGFRIIYEVLASLAKKNYLKAQLDT